MQLCVVWERTLEKYFVSTEGRHLSLHSTSPKLRTNIKTARPSNSTIIRSKIFLHHRRTLVLKWNVNRMRDSYEAIHQDIAARTKHTSQKPQLIASLLVHLSEVMQQTDLWRWVKQMAQRRDDPRRDGRGGRVQNLPGLFCTQGCTWECVIPQGAQFVCRGGGAATAGSGRF